MKKILIISAVALMILSGCAKSEYRYELVTSSKPGHPYLVDKKEGTVWMFAIEMGGWQNLGTPSNDAPTNTFFLDKDEEEE